MKRVVISLLVLIFAVSAICLAFLGWAGLFSEIRITEEKTGPFIVAYDVCKGPYRKTAGIMDKIYNTLLGEKGVAATRGFGLYYDKPGTVADEHLRSIAGCIIEKEYENKIQGRNLKFRTGIIPESNAVVARFPYKGKISVLIGVMRVYPELNRYMSEKKLPMGPVMEVYDVKNASISYIAANLDQAVLNGFLSDK